MVRAITALLWFAACVGLAACDAEGDSAADGGPVHNPGVERELDEFQVDPGMEHARGEAIDTAVAREKEPDAQPGVSGKRRHLLEAEREIRTHSRPYEQHNNQACDAGSEFHRSHLNSSFIPCGQSRPRSPALPIQVPRKLSVSSQKYNSTVRTCLRQYGPAGADVVRARGCGGGPDRGSVSTRTGTFPRYRGGLPRNGNAYALLCLTRRSRG